MELTFTTYLEPMDVEHLRMWIDRLPPDTLVGCCKLKAVLKANGFSSCN